jgi:hypothetical protein
MHWWKLTSRYGPSFAIILMLVTPTFADMTTQPGTSTSSDTTTEPVTLDDDYGGGDNITILPTLPKPFTLLRAE